MLHILHRFQAEEIIRKFATRPGTLSRSEVALLSAISFAAITSLPPAEVESKFGATKPALHARYRSAIEHALVLASLTTTKDLTTLQAFTLFLICLHRHSPARHFWILVGFALRLALALGLHRDGQNFGLPHYQTEMRRRLWWQIYILEIRAAGDQGCNATIGKGHFETRLPTNVDDEDLEMDAEGMLMSKIGVTDMTFGLVRCETVLLGHELQAADSSIEEKLRLIAVCEENIQKSYLQATSMQEPRAIVASVLARTAIANMKLGIQNPLLQSLDEENRESLFQLSISVLEDSIFLSKEPVIRQWVWASRKYVHWNPLIVVLMELCRRPPSGLTERAWRAVEGLLQCMVCDAKDAVLWRLIVKLIVELIARAKAK